jgi:flagellar basal-body rod protein FlgG
MLRALANAATGMKAQEMNIDVLSNNLANVNTSGYKKARAEFADVFYEQRRAAGAIAQDGAALPSGTEVGYGVRAVATYKNFNQGDLQNTGNPLDLTIEGRGFFQIIRPDGTMAYTRNSIFKTNADSQVVTVEGYAIEPAVSIPPEATSITISREGVVSVTLGNDVEQIEVGRIQLANFQNPSGLKSIGSNMFEETPASGAAMITSPGSEGAGGLLQGFVEGSNVTVVSEMIDLISAQRAYEVNSKVIQAADDMLRQTTRMG